MNALDAQCVPLCPGRGAQGRPQAPPCPARRQQAAGPRRSLAPMRAAAVAAEQAASPSYTPPPSVPDVSDAKYAIVEIGGTQLFVEEGRYYSCNRLQADPGCTIQLGRVLAVKEQGKLHLGTPWLESAVVQARGTATFRFHDPPPVPQAQVLEETRAKKVIIFKMNRKKHYRRKNGHRQPLTKFLITQITPSSA